MCSHYQAPPKPEIYSQAFGVAPPADLGKHDVWPGYLAGFIRRHPHADVGDEAVQDREALTGQFGLIPHWAVDATIGRRTYNARSETGVGWPNIGKLVRSKLRPTVCATATLFGFRSARAQL